MPRPFPPRLVVFLLSLTTPTRGISPCFCFRWGSRGLPSFPGSGHRRRVADGQRPTVRGQRDAPALASALPSLPSGTSGGFRRPGGGSRLDLADKTWLCSDFNDRPSYEFLRGGGVVRGPGLTETPQAIILLLFNGPLQWTVRDIQSSTQIDFRVCARLGRKSTQAHCLACVSFVDNTTPSFC